MDGYDPATYGDRFASVYDDWYAGITDAATCAALLADLADLEHHAGGGPVLELGVGTGRLALPLSELGVQVVGVDTSEAMLAELAAKPGGESIETVVGDMADPPVGDRSFAVVFVAYNTLFNLVTRRTSGAASPRRPSACCRVGRSWSRPSCPLPAGRRSRWRPGPSRPIAWC